MAPLSSRYSRTVWTQQQQQQDIQTHFSSTTTATADDDSANVVASLVLLLLDQEEDANDSLAPLSLAKGNNFTRTASWMLGRRRRRAPQGRPGTLPRRAVSSSLDDDTEDWSSLGHAKGASTRSRVGRATTTRVGCGSITTSSLKEFPSAPPPRRTRSVQAAPPRVAIQQPDQEQEEEEDTLTFTDDLTWDDAHSSISSRYLAKPSSSRRAPMSTTSSMRLAWPPPRTSYPKRMVYPHNPHENDGVSQSADMSWYANSSIASSCLHKRPSSAVVSTTHSVTSSQRSPKVEAKAQDGWSLTYTAESFPGDVPPSLESDAQGYTISPTTSLFAILSDESADQETHDESLSSASSSYVVPADSSTQGGEQEWASVSTNRTTAGVLLWMESATPCGTATCMG
jgi:hypothetical protein